MRLNAITVAGITASISLFSISTAANAQLQSLAAGGQDTFTSSNDLGSGFTPAGTQQAFVSSTFDSGVQGTSRVTGNYVSAVYLNGGTLDFYYQFSNSSSSTAPISGFTVAGYGNFTTSVGYTTANVNASDGFTTSTYAAGGVDQINRSGNGSVLTFDFSGVSGGGIANTGARSTTLLVRTNATSFINNANMSFQGGASANALGFAPTVASAAAPEPGALALAVPGLLGIVCVVRRRKSA